MMLSRVNRDYKPGEFKDFSWRMHAGRLMPWPLRHAREILAVLTLIVAGDEAFVVSPRHSQAICTVAHGRGQYCGARGPACTCPTLFSKRQQTTGQRGRAQGSKIMTASSSPYEGPARSILQLVLEPKSSNSWHDMGMLLQVPYLAARLATAP